MLQHCKGNNAARLQDYQCLRGKKSPKSLCPYMGKMAKKKGNKTKQNKTKVGVRVRPAVLVALKSEI